MQLFYLTTITTNSTAAAAAAADMTTANTIRAHHRVGQVPKYLTWATFGNCCSGTLQGLALNLLRNKISKTQQKDITISSLLLRPLKQITRPTIEQQYNGLLLYGMPCNDTRHLLDCSSNSYFTLHITNSFSSP